MVTTHGLYHNISCHIQGIQNLTVGKFSLVLHLNRKGIVSRLHLDSILTRLLSRMIHLDLLMIGITAEGNGIRHIARIGIRLCLNRNVTGMIHMKTMSIFIIVLITISG